jgi:hypothetical protein
MTDIKNHWSGFLNALAKNPMPHGSNSLAFDTTSSKIGVSGFLDIKPSNPSFQAKYDAMSASWEGVDASEKATLKTKVVTTDFMPYQK